MTLRIRFASEVYISGETVEEIAEKWCDLPLFSADALDADADYVQLQSAERIDDDSLKDYSHLL